MHGDELNRYEALSRQARCDLMEMFCTLGDGHVGGSLSIVDALVYLYFHEMNIRPTDPGWAGRDRFVLSKGHSGPALYAVLSLRGYFDKAWLGTLNQAGTNLPSHCDRKLTPGVDMTAGSLGQGLSVAEGMALSSRLTGEGFRVFCLVGDGELQEGQNWEALMYAAHLGLDNLVLLVDDNGMQMDDYTSSMNAVRPLEARLRAFGWETFCVDGHNFSALANAFSCVRTVRKHPSAIIMSTIKGKGLSLAEGRLSSHKMAFSQADIIHIRKEMQQERP